KNHFSISTKIMIVWVSIQTFEEAKLLYTIRTVTLKNGSFTKEVRVIEIKDSEQAILAEVLLSDSALLVDEISEEGVEMNQGKEGNAIWFGNRCRVYIEGYPALIQYQLEDMGINIATYPSYEIDDTALQQLMNMWLDVKDRSENNRA